MTRQEKHKIEQDVLKKFVANLTFNKYWNDKEEERKTFIEHCDHLFQFIKYER